MIEQLAFLIVGCICLMIICFVGFVFGVLCINTMFLVALLLSRLGRCVKPTNLMNSFTSFVFAPAAWAIRKMDEDQKP